MEQRKLEEMSFHDTRERLRLTQSPEEYEARYSNLKWYSTTERSHAFLDQWIARTSPNKTILDYCCGLGHMSLRFAHAGATVYGIDISPESIATARNTFQAAGLQDRCHFQVMDAENMTFPDDMFDVMMCSGVLHHLDVSKAFRELSRVLKPSGIVIAAEALGYNPVIRAYRKRTPALRTSWEPDHILRLRDIKTAKKYFTGVDIHYFHLFSILATPFRKTRVFRPILRMMNALDAVTLKIPGVQLMAWQMIFFLRGPRK